MDSLKLMVREELDSSVMLGMITIILATVLRLTAAFGPSLEAMQKDIKTIKNDMVTVKNDIASLSHRVDILTEGVQQQVVPPVSSCP